MAEQNPVLATKDSILDSLFGFAKEGFGIYSSFVNARETAELNKLNATYYQQVPEYSAQLAAQQAQTSQNAISLLVYGGIALALLGAGGLILKTFRK